MASALVTDSDTFMPHRIAPFVQHAAGYLAGTSLSFAAAVAWIQAAAHDPFSVLIGLGTMAGSLAMGYASAIKSYMAYVDWKENRKHRREMARIKRQGD